MERRVKAGEACQASTGSGSSMQEEVGSAIQRGRMRDVPGASDTRPISRQE